MFRRGLLKEKRILVTGGGSGLGKVMAERFAGLGAEVVICGRRREVLETAVQDIGAKAADGGSASFIQLDIRDPEAVEARFDELFATRPLDALVNNAAGNFLARTEKLSHRALDAVLQIVVHGTLYCTHACGRRWIANGQGGAVVSILASYAHHGSPYVVPSAIGKAAVKAMTRSLAIEWGKYGIRLNALTPGQFPTPGATEKIYPVPGFVDQIVADNPLRRAGEMSELGNAAAFLLADEVAFINGEELVIDGGRWLQWASVFGRLLDMEEERWQAVEQTRR
ncbi:MAG: SDR family oxidoreductase [Azospirillaceae bacterium]